MQDYNAMDIDTLTAITTLQIDDQQEWIPALNKFKEYITKLKNSPTHSLPTPFQMDTDNFLFTNVPTLVKKLLSIATMTQPYENATVDFLKEVVQLITLIVQTESCERIAKILPLILDILNPSYNFYIYNGMVNNMPYSQNLFIIAKYAATFYLPHYLLRCCMDPSLKIELLTTIAAVYDTLKIYLQINELFPSGLQSTIQAFQTAINRFIPEDSAEAELRKIPHKQLVKIITSFASLCPCEEIYSDIFNILMTFMQDNLAELKMSGFSLCVSFYTQILPEKDLNDAALSILEFCFNSVTSLEAFQTLKPVFSKIIEKNLMTKELLSIIWEKANSMHDSVLQQSLDLFTEIVIKERNTQMVIDIVSDTKNVEVLGKMIKSSFAVPMSQLLMNIAINDNNEAALLELTKSAFSYDLSNFIPIIFENISNPSLLYGNLSLLKAILTLKPTQLDVSPIIQSVITQCETSDEARREKLLSPLTDIISRSSSCLGAEHFREIIKVIKNDKYLSQFIKDLFPAQARILLDESALKDMVNLISEAQTKIESYDFFKHIFINILPINEFLSGIKDTIESSLWSVVLSPPNATIRLAASNLLLDDHTTETIPFKIYSYTKKCLDTLKEHDNAYAAIFINECLRLTSKYISLSSLNVEPHQFMFKEDMITFKVKNGSETKDITYNQQATVAQLATYIAGLFGHEVTAIKLYHQNSIMKTDIILHNIIKDDTVIDARFLTTYDPVPQFTTQNHPAFLLIGTEYIDHLLDLLKSNIGESIYTILIQVPTPSNFKVMSFENIDPKSQYMFLYQIHYLAKHLNELSNKNEIQLQIEDFLINHFDEIIPEARYILISLLNPETKNIKLVTVVAYKMCLLQSTKYFVRTMRKLWSIVSSFDCDLSKEVITTFLFHDVAKIRELALESHLIRSQSFDKIWDVFQQSTEQLKNIDILAAIDIPQEKYQAVFDALLPLFPSLNENLIVVFERIAENWAEFPVEKISRPLIDGFIKCTLHVSKITEAPFKLITTLIQRNEKLRTEIIEALDNTIPKSTEWNYQPTDSFKNVETNRAGLNNLGATCYINSVLQQIYSIPPLQNFIIENDFSTDESMNALHILFTNMRFSHRKYIEMKSFADNWFGWDMLPVDPKTQQDANEFLMLLFSRLEPYPDISKLISGHTRSTMSGVNDSFTMDRDEVFTILPLVVLGQNCIADSMKLMSKPELIKGYKPENYDHPIDIENKVSIVDLPPYLMIQLKRFDYSVVIGLKTKLDQRYMFEDEFDFKPYVITEQETRYRLKGIVLHQGEADLGHYFSYVKNGNEWICLNDIGVSVVKESIVKDEAYGTPEGSSAYLLLYERFDVQELAMMPEPEGNPELISKINDDNLHLLIDSVYFSPHFCDFIMSLMKIDSTTHVVFKYYMDSLTHSNMVSNFRQLTDTIAEMLRNNETYLDIFVALLLDRIDFIVYIMTECTNKSIRLAFSDTIKTVSSLLPTESDLNILIITQIGEWYDQIIRNWRNSFDIFKIVYDIASIDEEHCEFLDNSSIIDVIMNFFKVIPPYVANKDNKVTPERFKRLVDMTYIFKCFVVFKVDPKTIFTPEIMKWCVGSDNHATALVELIQQLSPALLSTFDKVIDSSKSEPSENLIVELMKYKEFRFPYSWLNQFFKEAPKQKHILRILSDSFLINPEDFFIFAEQGKQLFTHLLFSKFVDVRNEINILLQQLSSKVSIAEVMFPLIEKVIGLSKSVFAAKDMKLNKLPLDSFPGLQYLQFLVEITPQFENVLQYQKLIETTLHDILAIKAVRDEHAILIAQIGIMMIKMNNGRIENADFIADIQSVIVSMSPDHKQLDFAMRNYFVAVQSLFQNSKLSINVLLPDNELKTLLFKVICTEYSGNITKRTALELIKSLSSSQSAVAKIVISLSQEMPKYDVLDVKSIFEVISYFSFDKLKSSIQYLTTNVKILMPLFFGVTRIRVEEYFPKALVVLKLLAVNNSNQITNLFTGNPSSLKPYFGIALDNKVGIEAKYSALYIIEKALPCLKNDFQSLYGDVVFSKSLDEPEEIDEYTSELIHMMYKCWSTNLMAPTECKSLTGAPEFVQRKVADEFVFTMMSAESISMRTKTLNALSKLLEEHTLSILKPFFEAIEENEMFPAIWDIEPDDGVKMDGLIKLTLSIVERNKNKVLIEAILANCQKHTNCSSCCRIIEEIKKLQ